MRKKKTQPVQHIFVVPSNIPAGPELVEWCKKATLPHLASKTAQDRHQKAMDDIFSTCTLSESKPYSHPCLDGKEYTRHVFSRVQR